MNAPTEPTPYGMKRETVFCPHCAGHETGGARATDGHCRRCPPPEGPFEVAGCPVCSGTLAAEIVGQATVGRCSACAGTWFDRGAIFRAFDLRPRGTRPRPTLLEVRKAVPPPPPEPVSATLHPKCPRCAQPMARRPLAPLTGIVAQLCGRHGLWIGAGQIERFAAFVAAGGIDLALEEMERETEDAARSARSDERNAHLRDKRLRRGRPG